MQANQAVIDLLQNIATEKNATPAQVALGWLLARKPWIVPIPGTTRFERLEENIGAVELALDTTELAKMDDAASRITIHGARYPETLQKVTGK